MTNDRELLENAAKAAGIEGRWHEQNSAYASPTGWLMPNGHTWNPIADDGDALRLAVKLGIGVLFDLQDEKVTAYEPNPHDGYHDEFADEQDPSTATRRAIVRAAAEIGRSMI